MTPTSRRDFLFRLGAGGLSLSPLAAMLAACGKGSWPEGMAEIKWDRDTCVRCNMVISDQRFAAQMRDGAQGTIFKFDDLGCLLFWRQEQAGKYPWMAGASTRMWVADVDSPSRRDMHWLDPRQAVYITRTSPMGYNFAAVSPDAAPSAGAFDFTDMSRLVLSRGK